ncbi:hypothetical protein QN277_024147 [Acacia crassicarpa]|uniref:SKP1-like protein n=1 Tax=Acacia crassicarpa TaxID=499986 RepID=A0AAE1JBL6_9FABA|nr:hypothetical protein QN277_024147 [Acacia crassicarpa]
MTSSAMKVTVISSDGDEFLIPISVVEQSSLLKIAMGECDEGGKIPVSNVNSAILSKVLEYCHKHAGSGPKVAADEGEAANDDSVAADKDDSVAADKGEASNDAGGADEELKNWDAKFFKKTDKFNFIFDIILAANYLNISGLLDLGCQTVADRIKNKMPEEIREIFNLKNDFSPAEEAQIRKENEWAFEGVD